MNIKLTTEPTSEPVQLSDVLTHSRLDSTVLSDNIVTYQSIAPGDHVVAAAYSLVGTGVLVSGYDTLVNLNSGTNGSGGTVDVKIQESDNNATYTDWAGGAFTQVTEANDNAVQEKQYTGTKQYIRVVATVGTATCDFGVDILLSQFTPDDGSYITTLITVARKHVENHVLGGVALINQTWEYYLGEFPDCEFLELPRPPLSSITSITYTEAGDTTAYSHTYSSTNYDANTVSWPGGVQLRYGMVWPSVSLEENLPVKVTYVAGYGASRTTVPAEIKQCVLMYVDDMYEHRGVQEMMVGRETVYENKAADNLIQHYRVRRY